MLRVACAAIVWLTLNVAAWSGLLEPLPDFGFGLWLALAVSATLGAGLVAASWPFVALAIAPSAIAAAVGYTGQGDWSQMVPTTAAVAAVVVLVIAVAASRVAPGRTALVTGALLLVAPAPLVAWGAARTVWPHDAHPAHALQMRLPSGGFRGVTLGQPIHEARTRLRGSVETDTSARPTPLDAPSAPVGVTFTPADATILHGHGLAAIADQGRIVTLFITDPRAEAIAGVGIGDNLGLARDRLRNLVCHDSSEGQPTCGGRVGGETLLLVGDPIRTIALSSIDTGWCLVPSPTCPHAPTKGQISVR
jgi:hypothetical protein